MIRQATKADYIKLLRSIQVVSKSAPYINKNYLKEDIEKGACYINIINNKFVAICSLVYDENHKMYYFKRLTIPNKKNRGKGYAKEMLQFVQSIATSTLAVTPWEDNYTMRTMLEKLGFHFQYKFLDKYMLYTYQK